MQLITWLADFRGTRWPLSAIALAIALAAICLTHGAAQPRLGIATITSVKVNPLSIKAGETGYITVTSQGKCAQFKVVFGDGTSSDVQGSQGQVSGGQFSYWSLHLSFSKNLAARVVRTPTMNVV